MRKYAILILLLIFLSACATRNNVENISRQNSDNSSSVAASNSFENKNLSSAQNSANKYPENSNLTNNSSESKETKATTNSIERIRFAKGATSAIVTGKLNDYRDSKSFLIEVKQGQTLKTEQVKETDSLKYITVAIQDSKGKYVGDSDASCNNRKEIKPTEAGDYRLNVSECMKADAWRGQFKLKVSVE